MTDEATPDIDPRFDPAFQRGFDPAAPGTAQPGTAQPGTVQPALRPRLAPPSVPSAPVARQAASPSAPTSAQLLRAAPPQVGSAQLAAQPDAEKPPVVRPDGDEHPESSAADSYGTEPRSLRNPYLLFLAVVAVILVGVGIWLFTQTGAEFNAKQVRSAGDFQSLDATIHAAPFVSLLGVATAVGVLFVFAAQWRRRK